MDGLVGAELQFDIRAMGVCVNARVGKGSHVLFLKSAYIYLFTFAVLYMW